jgi:hypothetical protein
VRRYILFVCGDPNKTNHTRMTFSTRPASPAPIGVQIDYNVVHLRTFLVQLFVLLLQIFEKVVQIIELRDFEVHLMVTPLEP